MLWSLVWREQAKLCSRKAGVHMEEYLYVTDVKLLSVVFSEQNKRYDWSIENNRWYQREVHYCDLLLKVDGSLLARDYDVEKYSGFRLNPMSENEFFDNIIPRRRAMVAFGRVKTFNYNQQYDWPKRRQIVEQYDLYTPGSMHYAISLKLGVRGCEIGPYEVIDDPDDRELTTHEFVSIDADVLQSSVDWVRKPLKV